MDFSELHIIWFGLGEKQGTPVQLKPITGEHMNQRIGSD